MQELTVQLYPDHFAYTVFDTKGMCHRVLKWHKLEEVSQLSAAWVNQVKAFFYGQQCLQHEYKKVTVELHSPKYTLVPKVFFDPDEAVQFLDFNQHLEDDEQVLWHELGGDAMQLVYSVPSDICTFLKQYFHGRVELKHCLSSLALAGSQESLREELWLLQCHTTGCHILIFKGKKLDYANFFPCTGVEDLLFYVHQLMSVRGTSGTAVNLCLSGSFDPGGLWVETIKTYVSRVNFLQYPVDFVPPEGGADNALCCAPLVIASSYAHN